MDCCGARLARLGQRLSEVEVYETAPVVALGGRQFLKIVLRRRHRGLIKLAMEHGVLEIDHSEDEVGASLLAWVDGSTLCTEAPCRLMIMPLFVEFHRTGHRVVGGKGRRGGNKKERRKEEPETPHT